MKSLTIIIIAVVFSVIGCGSEGDTTNTFFCSSGLVDVQTVPVEELLDFENQLHAEGAQVLTEQQTINIDGSVAITVTVCREQNTEENSDDDTANTTITTEADLA